MPPKEYFDLSDSFYILFTIVSILRAQYNFDDAFFARPLNGFDAVGQGKFFADEVFHVDFSRAQKFERWSEPTAARTYDGDFINHHAPSLPAGLALKSGF
jgi:hypothetical protein